MTLHRATCADCAWSREGEDLIEVTDKMERHGRKEQHHVDLDKAVATDGGEPTTTVDADATLRLTDDGIEMPEFLKGYTGSFTLRTADITGTYQTSESGMPETDFFDGPIAVYPADDGDYNSDLAAGFMAIGTPEHGEEIFEVVDERDEEDDDPEPIADGSGGFAFEDSLEYGQTPIGQKTHLIDFETDSALARGSDSGPDQTLCGRVGDFKRAAAPAESQFCQQCAAKTRKHGIDLEAVADRSKQPIRTDGEGGVTTRSDTAFEQKQRFYDRISAELQPDVGPVDDIECEARCEAEAVYRVPWPHIGGDTALCGYHLGCYRHDQSDIWGQVRTGPFEDPDDYVEIGTRFVSLDEIPDEIRDGNYRLICLDSEGYALYEGKPDDGHVTFLRVDSRLNDIERNTVRQEIVGELIGWYRQNIGWRRLAPEAEEALLG
jgi:hypothetical protein